MHICFFFYYSLFNMAWMCSAKTNEALIKNLHQANILKNERVIQAMKTIDRKDYCPRYAYDDSPQSIGYGATISAPHMHGYALEYLEPYLKPGMKALDIGSGSGYLSACMMQMVESNDGKVIGIEHIKELVDSSIRNVQKSHPEWIHNEQLKFIEGDGRLGYEPEGPYDCIHVGAAAPSTPENLLKQLKSPGRLFIPVGTDTQWVMIYDKDDKGNIHEKKWIGVQYVPLTDVKYQKTTLYG
ncbi:protein-L-isoaspartate O-methyltransferase [Cokeromyces recurvatus]|uniref:protein-L-isoaspartate O-methyltransferase n=1 Tax=Cokeromyces recurvatus TaxID=90255 RepID=UPI00221F29A5|nr:protein-L-isoaspartate O-methyltransferase [Cokeromyces recurvatus]KAI7903544.1 protein-L-isoaspartate O-methyltransferase [Cokeromyces recurvatus]